MKLLELRKSSIGTFLVMAVTVMTVGGLGVASAHVKTVPTTVTFTKAVRISSPGLAKFKGRVFAGPRFCKKRREVQVMDLTAGRRLLTVRANRFGSWKGKGTRPPKGHKVQALVEAKIRSGPAHTHTCREDFSPVKKYPFR